MTNKRLELVILIICSVIIFGFMFYMVHGLQVHGQSPPLPYDLRINNEKEKTPPFYYRIWLH